MQRSRETAVGPAVPIPNPQTKLEFSDDHEVRLVGNSSLALRVEPSGNPISILYPRRRTPASRWRARRSWSSGSR